MTKESHNLKLTTVKIFEDKYQQFQVMNVHDNMTLQKLVNRSLHLYLSDTEYRSMIKGTVELQESGSAF